MVLTKLSFREEQWALGNDSMKFRDFPDRFLFPKILSFKLLGNLRGNSYIPVYY